MKISLLATREDFGAIFIESLRRFCRSYFGHEIPVKPGKEGGLCFRQNAELNIIYPEHAPAEALKDLTAEFWHHDRLHRRLLQGFYCMLSTARSTRRMMSKPLFSVDAETSRLQHWVFLPGNHSIRIVDTQQGQCIVFPKTGFESAFFLNDAHARRRYDYLHVPAVLKIAATEDWYIEERIIALPVTRFGDPHLEDRVHDQAMRDLCRLRAETLETSTLGQVFDKAHELGQQIIQSLDTLPEAVAARLDSLLVLCARLTAVDRVVTLPSCITHGDFQPGNLLTDGTQFWLIDWEYYGRRSILYDYFTWSLRARHSGGLGERLDAAIVAGASAPILDVWGHKQHGDISALIAVFLAEDLLVKLQEIRSPAIVDKAYSLGPWLDEVLPFLARLEKRRLNA